MQNKAFCARIRSLPPESGANLVIMDCMYYYFYERLMDMQYKRFVEELKQQVDTYLQQVNSIGNECAYTDRLLEQIITKAKQIEQVYHNN